MKATNKRRVNFILSMLLCAWLTATAQPSTFLQAEASGAKQKDSAKANQQSATVPLIVEFNRPFVDLEFTRPDGKTRKARFWVDTGGGGFILCEPLARELELKTGEEGSEGGLRFAMTTAPQSRIGGMLLDLEGARAIVALGKKTIDAGVAAEGMLPGHVLKRYHVIFDYPARRFTIARPGSLKPRGVRVATPIHERTGFPRLEAEVGGATFGFLLDTGASFTMISEEQLEKWAAANADWKRATGAFGAANMGLGQMEAKLMMLRIPTFAIDKFKVEGAAAVARPKGTFENYMSKLMTAPIIGAIGGNVLKLFRVEIDYANGATYLEQRASYDKNDLDMVGLILKPAGDGTYPVVAVSNQYPGEILDKIKAGDRLISVDDIHLNGAMIDRAVNSLRGKPGQVRALTLEREGKQFTVKAPVMKLL